MHSRRSGRNITARHACFLDVVETIGVRGADVQNGLVDLTERDVTANPAGIRIARVESARAPRALEDVDHVAMEAVFYGGVDAPDGPLREQIASLGMKSPLLGRPREPGFRECSAVSIDGQSGR
jgi:hypothetical protein